MLKRGENKPKYVQWCLRWLKLWVDKDRGSPRGFLRSAFPPVFSCVSTHRWLLLRCVWMINSGDSRLCVIAFCGGAGQEARPWLSAVNLGQRTEDALCVCVCAGCVCGEQHRQECVHFFSPLHTEDWGKVSGKQLHLHQSYKEALMTCISMLMWS